MNRILYIGIFCLLFGALEAQADAGYDPMMYDNEEEFDENLFSIIPPTPITVGIKKENDESNTPVVTIPKEEENIEEKNVTDAKQDENINIPEKPTIPIMNEETSNIQPVTGLALPSTDENSTNISPSEAIDPKVTKSSGSDTWIDSGLEALKQKSDTPTQRNNENSLEKMMDTSRKNKKRTNASVFDISGVMLRMTLAQVEDILKSKKFTKVSEKFEIPNFIKWRNEEKCRNNGVVGYERLNSCVVTLAKQDGHQYPESVKFARFDTKEEIVVNLTSNFSNNKVYRIYYSSMSPAITGNSAKATYLRNIKIYDFWKKINRKYGAPDNKDEVIWGLGGDKPYLQASSGKLLLEDPMLRELDYTRMSREDQRFMNTELYNF